MGSGGPSQRRIGLCDPKAATLVEESGTLLSNPESWEFLLGEERRGVISLLLQRLAPYFGPLVAPSVAASVEVWGTVVSRSHPRDISGAPRGRSVRRDRTRGVRQQMRNRASGGRSQIGIRCSWQVSTPRR